jgi:ribosome-binding factor A
MNQETGQTPVRIKKVNRLIQEELGKIIQEVVELPRGVMVTITGVDTSADVKHAKIKVSVIPREKTKGVLEILGSNIFELQQMLNKKLILRYVPKIRFVIDRSQERVERIEELLEQEKGQ